MDFIDEFISEYKNNPCLWKADSANFKNRTKRQEAYMKLIEVAAKHGEHYNVERTKQKINNLRCAFRHQLKKYTESKKKGEKEELYCPKRKYFESLLFLKDEEIADKTKNTCLNSESLEYKVDYTVETGNIPEITVLYEKNSPNIIAVTNPNDECQSIDDLSNQRLEETINTTVIPSKETSINAASIIGYEEISNSLKDNIDFEKACSTKRFEQRQKRSFSECSRDSDFQSTKLLKVDVKGSDFEKLIEIICSNSSRNNDDSFSSYGKFVAHKLKIMEPSQAMFAEKLIADVLFQGQMKLLTAFNVNRFEKYNKDNTLNDSCCEK